MLRMYFNRSYVLIMEIVGTSHARFIWEVRIRLSDAKSVWIQTCWFGNVEAMDCAVEWHEAFVMKLEYMNFK